MLTGKTIVVTGAASGIGAETAKEIKKQGGTVIAVDVNEPSENVDQYIQANLGDPASIKAAVETLPDTIHGLCNIAGLPPTKDPKLVLQVNFIGLRDFTEQVIAKLADNGSVVNLASLAGAGWPEAGEQVKALLAVRDYDAVSAICNDYDMAKGRSYFLTKEALIVWTMMNRWTWRERGIRMNCISPGPVDTPILQDFVETLGKRVEEDMRVMDRPGTPKDIAPVCAFLLSDGSSWLRGTNIAADGGMFSHIQCGMFGYE